MAAKVSPSQLSTPGASADTGDIIVHVFRPEVREFYQLEKIWMPTGAAATV